MFRLLSVLIVATMLVGCTWISRDYYFSGGGEANDWVGQYIPGKDSDKSGTHPASELLSFTNEEIEIEVDVNYQDLLLFGPIIPFIPTPLKTNEKLSLALRIESKYAITINPLQLNIADLNTGTRYVPFSVYPSSELESNSGKLEYFIQFPVGVRELNNIEISFGEITANGNRTLPPTLKLKKVKGETHLNQFTM